MNFAYYGIEKVKIIFSNFQIFFKSLGFVKEENYDEGFHDAFKPIRDTLISNFIEKFSKVYVTQINTFFRVMFTMVKPFLNQNTM